MKSLEPVAPGSAPELTDAEATTAVMPSKDELRDRLATLGERLDTSRFAEIARSCPVCEAPMNQLAIDAIVIERCPRDRSMWFERGWGTQP